MDEFDFEFEDLESTFDFEFDSFVIIEHGGEKYMVKHLLAYDGTSITENGEALTFDQLYSMLMELPAFVVLVHSNYAYHPNGVSREQIVFASSYPVNGYDRAHRITMLASGAVTMTETESEHTSSRVNAITDLNKDSTTKYTSAKAVVDYVAGVTTPIKEDLRGNKVGRVTTLDDTKIADGVVFEAIGCPEYIDAAKLSQYAQYGLAEAGWYVFARIHARENDSVGSGFGVTGAAGFIMPSIGAAYVDVAIRFGVTAETQCVVVNWGNRMETFVFKATDLATRNLDYRVTFYLYDIKDYCTFEYALTADTAFAADKKYYTMQGGEYVEADVTVGAAVPANTYYNHSKLTIEGFVRNVSYFCDLIDCPLELHLPEVSDDGYGAWFEIQFKADASRSVTIVPHGDAKVSGNGVQTPKVGINIINMQYHKPTATWLPTVTTWTVASGG